MGCGASDDSASDAPLACSLQGRDLADRQHWLADLQGRAREVEQSAAGVTLRFPDEAGLEAELRALAEAEEQCCEFLRVGVRRVGGLVELAVVGPATAQPVIEEMFGRRA
jgi:hypothetical protein